MTEPELIDVDTVGSGDVAFYVYRYSNGSVQVRKSHGNEVARQHGIHTINLTEAEGKALARILNKPAKRQEITVLPDMRHPELYIGNKTC